MLNLKIKHDPFDYMTSSSTTETNSNPVRSLRNRNAGSSIGASSTPSSPFQVSSSSPPRPAPAIANMISTIFPRFPPVRTAHWHPFAIPSPMVITRELIDTLHGLPLPRAARTVGVSATAFKKACRRLGITRWDYTRGPGRRPGTDAADPPDRSKPACRLIAAAGQQSGQASVDCRPPPPCCLSVADQSRSGSERAASPEPDFKPCRGSTGDGCLADGPAELDPGRPVCWRSEGQSLGLADSDDALVLAMLAWPWREGAPRVASSPPGAR
jgi:hypothetical protein